MVTPAVELYDKLRGGIGTVDAADDVPVVASGQLEAGHGKSGSGHEIDEAGLELALGSHVPGCPGFEELAHEPDARAALHRQIFRDRGQERERDRTAGQAVVDRALDSGRVDDRRQVDERAGDARRRNPFDDREVLSREQARAVHDGVAAPVSAGTGRRRLRRPAPGEAGYAEESGRRSMRRDRPRSGRECERHQGLFPGPLAPTDAVDTVGHALPAAGAQAVLDGAFRGAQGGQLRMRQQRVLRLGELVHNVHGAKGNERL
ncbi:MAG TPA: hypothetical protein VHH09_05255 [Acidimicrobiales bacterium]|nr:hypothetical protein [Acidimicrobiales bacterium]